MAASLSSIYQVNTSDSDVLRNVVSTQLNNGNVVVVWQSEPIFSEVRAQIVTPDGVKVGNELTINNLTEGTQDNPSVTHLADGGFLVSWTDDQGLDGNLRGVFARAYDADGTPRGGQFQVNQTTFLDQDSSSVTGIGDDGAFVAFETDDGRDLVGRTFSDPNVPSSNEFIIDARGAYVWDTATLNDGDTVVMWMTNDSNGVYLLAQKYSPLGVAVGSQITIATASIVFDINVSIVEPLANGGFVTVWHPLAGQGGGIFFRIFDEDGQPVTEALRADDISLENHNPAVATLGNGGFVIVWGTNNDLAGQVFDQNGQPQGEIFVIDDETAGVFLDDPKVVPVGDDDFVVSWIQGDMPNPENIYAQHFTTAVTPDPINGTDDNDVLIGGPQDDVITGFGGDDFIDGGLGDDILSGTGVSDLFGSAIVGIDDFSVAQGWISFDSFPRLLGDVGSDVDDDIVGFGASFTLSALSNADGTFEDAEIAIDNFSQAQGWASFDSFPRLLADIDGDTFDDIVGFGAQTTFSSLAEGEGTFAPVEIAINNFSQGQGWSSFDEFPRLMGDIDGDGNSDIVGFGAQTTFSSLSNGDGTFGPVEVAVNNFSQGQGWSTFEEFPRLLGDVNGDDYLDIVGFGAQTTFVSLGIGDGTFAPVQVAINDFSQGQGWSSFDEFPRALGDINGDGLDDIIGFGAQATLVSLSNGDGTFDPVQVAFNNFGQAQGWSSFDEFPRMVGDINGDSADDIIGYGANESLVYLANWDEDTFAFSHDAFGNDTVTDYNDSADFLDFSGTSYQFADFTITSINSGADTLIDTPGNSSVTLLGVSSSLIGEEDFIF